MIKDLSSSYKELKPKSKIRRFYRGLTELSNEYDFESERKQELVQTGTAEERRAFKAELYLNVIDDGSFNKICYRCGKVFIPKPWNSSSLCILCKDCEADERAKAKKEEAKSNNSVRAWKFKALQDRTQHILDLFNRSY